MTEVTEAMIEAGLAVFKIGPTGWSATDAATVADIYETMEAAHIPAPAPDVVERVAKAMIDDPDARKIALEGDAPDFDDSSPEVQDYWLALARAAMSAIPIPAPTGDLQVQIAALAYERARDILLQSDADEFAIAVISLLRANGIPATGEVERAPGSEILDHKYLDPECIGDGGQSLVGRSRYEAAVKGRQDFRRAYREAQAALTDHTTKGAE